MNQARSSPGGEFAISAPAPKLRVLTLSLCFPNPAETVYGVFVERRMKQVGQTLKVTVLAPISVVEYSNPNQWLPAFRQIPRHLVDGPLEVYYPRWFYPPYGGGANGVLLGLQMWRHARKIAANGGIDLIDAHFAHPEGVAAAMLARLMKKPFMITLRGIEQEHIDYPSRRKAMSWALRRATRVVAVSERLRQLAISLGCAPEKAVTIPNGIDGHVFHPYDPAAARREFGLPADRKIILSAGYLIERKGHHRVARSLRDLLNRGENAFLAIAGGPGRGDAFESVIRQTIAELHLENDVRLLGAVPPEALARLMSACDVFALATRNEGWPNVVHEAMGCGAPVVATDVGAIPDMIQSDDFGYVVPFDDQPALSGALSRALSRSWDRQVISSWALSRSWDNVGSEVIDVMQSAVADDKMEQLKAA